jgi:hypothetical protein
LHFPHNRPYRSQSKYYDNWAWHIFCRPAVFNLRLCLLLHQKFATRKFIVARVALDSWKLCSSRKTIKSAKTSCLRCPSCVVKACCNLFYDSVYLHGLCLTVRVD